MKIAFYAPLKPPSHSRPSGDRRMARLLMTALQSAGFEVEVASTFRSRDGAGDARRQQRIEQLGARLAARCVRGYSRRAASERPSAWFTYHLYHKAPDWLGPPVAAALGIPYVVAEASHAPKQANGGWARGHAAAGAALAQARLVFSPNAADDACVMPLLRAPSVLRRLAPFLDLRDQPRSPAREAARAALAAESGLDPGAPWIACVAMMRHDVKIASYRLLTQALQLLRGQDWRLLVAGDGVARADVETLLAQLPGGRVHMLGECEPARLSLLLAAADVCAWPALGEAYGMALLEAQAAGVPVVAGRSGGVAGVVADGESGILVQPDDVDAFADALAGLLDDPARRRQMSQAASERVRRLHDLPVAAAALRDALLPILAAAPADEAQRR